MKTTILKHKLFYFFILLSLAIYFNGCSTDDDDITSQTFLEKYDGTKWVNTDEFTIYIRLNDNINKLVETWFLFGDCYFYDYDFESEGVEIVENSENKLIIKYTDDGDIETVTVTIQGETLKVVIKEGNEEEIIYFDKTSVNVDDLEICPDLD